MNLVAVHAFLLLLLGGRVSSVGAGSMILMDPEVPLKKCRYVRSYDLFQAQCKDLRLHDIPSTLKSGIEVLDARENRIRELRNDTLSRYTSLRYLYLQDNFVQSIPENSFAPTYYLEVLDLSKNGLRDLPRSLFQMLSLRNLYLNDNQLGDSAFNVSGVRAPLQWLHLSNTKLTRLPRLTPMATVSVLNVSRNYIDSVTAEDIAALCSLQVLDLTGNPLAFNDSSCQCYEFKEWIAFRKIKVLADEEALECPGSMREYCSVVAFSNRTMTLYGGCVTNLRDRAEARKARSTWIWIASCIGAFLACIFVALCCMHKRNRNKRQRLKEQKAPGGPPGANTEQLLNKEITLEQS